MLLAAAAAAFSPASVPWQLTSPSKHSPDKHSPDKHSPDKHSPDKRVRSKHGLGSMTAAQRWHRRRGGACWADLLARSSQTTLGR